MRSASSPAARMAFSPIRRVAFIQRRTVGSERTITSEIGVGPFGGPAAGVAKNLSRYFHVVGSFSRMTLTARCRNKWTFILSPVSRSMNRINWLAKPFLLRSSPRGFGNR